MEILINISVPKWNIEALNGYKPLTSFWADFSIADKFGVKGLKKLSTTSLKNGKITTNTLQN